MSAELTLQKFLSEYNHGAHHNKDDFFALILALAYDYANSIPDEKFLKTKRPPTRKHLFKRFFGYRKKAPKFPDPTSPSENGRIFNWTNSAPNHSNSKHPFAAHGQIIRSLIDAEPDLFNLLFWNLDNPEFVFDFCASRPFLEDIVSKWAKPTPRALQIGGLASEGVSRCTGRISPETIEDLRSLAIRSLGSNTKNPTIHIRDLDGSARQLIGERSSTHFSEGRDRVNWTSSENISLILRRYLSKANLSEYLSEIIGVPLVCVKILAERLSAPTVCSGDHGWHIDNLSDQIKIMIPLSDISDKSGPLIYIPKSHNRDLVSRHLLSKYHSIFKLTGLKTSTHACFFDNETVSDLFDQSIPATCKTGDMITFDSRIIHTGSQCDLESSRENIVLYFQILSNKHKALAGLPAFY